MIVSLFLAALAAPLQDAAASPISHRFHPGEESKWTFEKEGKPIGQHSSRYLGVDDLAGKPAHHFVGWLRIELSKLGDKEQRSNADLWIDEQGHPTRFTTRGYVGDLYSRAELLFDGTHVHARVMQGDAERHRTVEWDPEALMLANNFISHFEIALAFAKPGEDSTIKMFSGNSIKRFNYTLTAKGTFEVEKGGVKETGYLYDDSLDGKLRVLDGRLLGIGVESAKIVINRSDEKIETFTIVPPEVRDAVAAFAVEEVKVPVGTGVIAGSVTKPKDAQGRLPAVFFVSGSGTQDRNGITGGFDLGTHEILDRLTADGFLVLRVDDRGAGESSLAPADMSYSDLVSDARACVEFLKKRDDVDPSRVAVIGHSEGGETASILATEPLGIAAIVLLGPPGRTMLAVLTDRNRMALEGEGLKGEELDAKLAQVVDLLKRSISDKAVDVAELSFDQRAIVSNRAWLRGQAGQDPIATIREVRCPVLILQGAKDSRMSMALDAQALDAALKDAGNADHELRALDNLDHLFKEVPAEETDVADSLKPRPVDPKFLDALSAWLCKRLKVEPH